jgi:cytochrome bd-type quinol oxidase subunit 2
MKMRAPISTAIAIAVGLVTLLGYFFLPEELRSLRTLLLGWGITLAGMAGLVGVAYLFGVHWRRLGARRGRDIYSLFFLLAFLATVGFGLWLTPADPQYQQVVLSIQTPIEISLLAVLAFTMAIASMRLLRQRKGWISVVFVISVLLFLVLRSGLLVGVDNLPGFRDLIQLLNSIPLAGARGILLGVALGSLTAGLRILFGADRPYSG